MRTALTESVRQAVQDLELTGIHVVGARLFAWRINAHHDAVNLPPKLDAVVQLAAGLPKAP